MSAAPGAQSSSLATLQTRAERSDFTETSRYDDVLAFLNVVDQASPLVHITSFGYTFEGRSLPLAVVGKIADARVATVRASGKLRVYIQANIHAGEVEGKEAALALVRDLARGQHASWLDAMVLLVNPIYNADGNEKVTLTSRGFQHGPVGGQGTRPNAQGLNINRDNMKLDTPEARSMVRLLNDFDPHVLIDLHTTNGSRHAYHLTYETPNNPAVDGALASESRAWMASVREAIKKRDGWDFHAYGNVSGQPPDRVWRTVEDLPRYTHNYWGIRNRFGILSETYSYLPFRDRVITNQRFLEEVLGYAHANAARLRTAPAAADRTTLIGQRVSLRSRPVRAAETRRDSDGRCRGGREPVFRSCDAQAPGRAPVRADVGRSRIRNDRDRARAHGLLPAGRREPRDRASPRARHRHGAHGTRSHAAARGVPDRRRPRPRPRRSRTIRSGR